MQPSTVWLEINSDQTPFVSRAIGDGICSSCQHGKFFIISAKVVRSIFVVSNYQLRTYRLDSFVFSEGDSPWVRRKGG